MKYPPPITKQEFLAKLTHLTQVIKKYNYRAIYLESEGAMRYLTGMRHQVIDIHPSSKTTIAVIITVKDNSYTFDFYSEPWEHNRLKDMVSRPIFQLKEINTTIQSVESLSFDSHIIHPTMQEYKEIEREIISPLVEKLEGNQYKKLEFLISSSRSALLEVGHKVKVGMNGWLVRSLVYEAYHKKHLELNQVLVSLHGMEKHQHPMVDDESIIKKGDIIKIVTGSRYIDMLHSATQLVKIDSSVTEEEMTIYDALLRMSIEYASMFTSHTSEKELYDSLPFIAKRIEEEEAIPYFSKSAHTHHGGGPMSPLGNRDFVVSKDGKRRLFPYAQFSINPVDSIMNFKCELQGIVIPHELPLILDEFINITNHNEYKVVQYKKADLRLPTIITN